MDSTEYAFKLAETYRDFHALSELSHHASADKTMSTPDRIRGYLDRFRGDFASQLYKWYIEQGWWPHVVDNQLRLISGIRQTEVAVRPGS